jgi:hypothetical protein
MSDTTATVTTAGQVRGREVTGGILFAGLPLAQPPVGALRMRPPQPLSAWRGVRAAEQFPGPGAVRYRARRRRFAATGEPGWAGYDPGAAENARLFANPGGLTTEPPHDEVTAYWR